MEKSKLTAYALNEVSETERIEIEKYLDAHPMEKAEVEEIKLVSAILKSEMATDLVVKAPEIKKKKSFSFLWQPRTLALTISLGFVGLLAVQVVKEQSKSLDSLSAKQKSIVMNEVATPQPSTPIGLSNKNVAKGPSEPQKISGMNSAVGSGASAPALQAQMSAETRENEGADFAGAPTSGDPQGMPKSAALGGGSSGGISTQGRGARISAVKRKVGLLSSFGNSNKDMQPRAEGKSKAAFAEKSVNADETDVTAGEEYKINPENDMISVSKEPLSTFSIDVDTASYTNARRYLNNYNQIPPADSIRTEEFINYFDYDYAAPTGAHPIAVHMEVAKSPWNLEKTIVRVGLKAKEINQKDRPKSNLVFLIDVSGSMADENKLPLVKSALRTLAEQLNENDRISMVVYAGQSGVVLDSVAGNKKDKILAAIQQLSSGGSTNGEGGIRKAYEIAQKNYITGGNNRVILASDGDFNVGVTSSSELLKIIKEKSEGGVFLTVLGFGMGNFKDARMEEISNKGQGNYFYIDSTKEADKVFVNQLMGTLFTIAKDVKVQLEFNPKLVKSYRLVGYENRMLQKEDFSNDKVDAGEMGAGHSVTALYEIEMKDNRNDSKDAFSDEILTAKVRYKKPLNSSSEYFDQALKNNVSSLEKASCSTRFAVAVASFSQWMRKSEHVKGFDSDKIVEIAQKCISTQDKNDSFKVEFLGLVRKARDIRK